MITSNLQVMGGNGSYIVSVGGVPMDKRTHTDTNYRVDGHKVLVQTKNPLQRKCPVNSNSENPIYLCGTTDKNGKIRITTIGVYDNHKLVYSIDIEYDKKGDIIPYSNGGKGTTHAHKWPVNSSSGDVGRKSHDPKNSLPYGRKYVELLKNIADFNKKGKIWKQ